MRRSAFTSEFHRDYQVQTARMLRPRFMAFLVTFGVLYALFLIPLVVLMLSAFGLAQGALPADSPGVAPVRWGTIGLALTALLIFVDIAIYVWCWLRLLRRPMGRDELSSFTLFYFALRGVLDIAFAYLVHASTYPAFPYWLLMYHLMACLILPWSPSQAIRAVGGLLVLNALAILVFRDSSAAGKSVAVVLSLLAPAPGVLVSWLKQSRRMENFRVQMLQSRYGEMRRELFDARRIHEALFPPTITDGPVRLDYRYQPMRQIGGDYLYARSTPGPSGGLGRFSALILDVTGHGIAAALTVNRLYGEVERLFAENPDIDPGSVLSALNRYVSLTLASHSIFATALCIRIDLDTDQLEYASGGHPPAFLLTADGKIHELASTSFVLGACNGPDFHADPQRLTFAPGDALIAYTDGAIETRNDQSAMLGINGLTRALVSTMRSAGPATNAPGVALAAALISAVESHRSGAPEDDTLIVEVRRPPTVAASSGAWVDRDVAPVDSLPAASTITR
jgi:serine phosphatase RsbU (regulator of sigma subunit)